MAEYHADIIIHGGGIAGLWALNALRAKGYNVLLLENNAIGGGQTLASQGIIHSGLKYMVGGKISEVARQISAMPERWLKSDLNAHIAAPSQLMLIPKGFAGDLVKMVAKNALGTHAAETSLPDQVRDLGFNGSAISLNEPVFDIPQMIRALAQPHINAIRKSPDNHHIEAKQIIYTAAEGNAHDGITIQKRPLVMGLIRGAPFHLHAHLVGLSDKPVATITSHIDQSGKIIWYVGGGVAEHEKLTDPSKIINAIKLAIRKYMPALDISHFEWATYPVDRIESTHANGLMPDLPAIQEKNGNLYAWPTKLTFAPLLSDMLLKKLEEKNITPSNAQADWSHLPPVDYGLAPWDKVTWKKEN